MTRPEAWALDPWMTDEIRFLPVDGEHVVYRFPAPEPPPILGSDSTMASFESTSFAYRTVWRKRVASRALGRSVEVYVADVDQGRLLAALRAAERAVMLFMLIGRRPIALLTALLLVACSSTSEPGPCPTGSAVSCRPGMIPILPACACKAAGSAEPREAERDGGEGGWR